MSIFDKRVQGSSNGTQPPLFEDRTVGYSLTCPEEKRSTGLMFRLSSVENASDSA